MNEYEQLHYSAGWAARKAFKRRDGDGRYVGSQAEGLWFKGYDDCELYWNRLL